MEEVVEFFRDDELIPEIVEESVNEEKEVNFIY